MDQKLPPLTGYFSHDDLSQPRSLSRISSRSSSARSKVHFVPNHLSSSHLYDSGKDKSGIGRASRSEQRSHLQFRQNRGGRTNPSKTESNLLHFLGNPWGGRDPDGFVQRSRDEDCIKCMLRIKHNKCESHKYIRVGGGYRHSYWYVKVLLEELEFQHQQEIMRRQRLEAIAEGNLRAVKTYIRTKSGRLIERIIFMSEEDYQNFQDALAQGRDPADILKRYLNKEEANGLEGYDREEQKAMKMFIRTKSGRLIEKIVYISREEYDAIKRGEKNANDVLRKHLNLKDGEQLESWGDAKMRTITTYVRTKSGRLIEKKIMISEEDYLKLQNGGNLNDIMKKYMTLDPGQKLEAWEKPKKQAMKSVKIFVRTKSGRLVEKTILMTEEEFRAFQQSGGDPNFLKKFIKLNEGESIDRWEKQSTVYAGSDDDEDLAKAKAGDRIVGKDGTVYEVVVDPITGKKFMRKVGDTSRGSLSYKTKNGRILTEKDIINRQKQKGGKRVSGSDSEYSYRSVYSANGTRHVIRRKKNPDGTRGDDESYHSSQDEEGEKRRRKRRRDRKHGADSAHSYYSVVSAGGTRHVRRKKKNADGTYAASESYHSDDSEDFKEAAKAINEKKKEMNKKKREHGSDSEYSYFSEVSEGGTRRRMRRKRIRDERGNIRGYGKKEEYNSDSDGKGAKGGKGRKGKKHDSDSDYSYTSEVSAGGTRRHFRRQKIRDKDGKVIGYGKKLEYSSDEDEGNKKGKKGGKKHGSDSEYSYYSEVSEGGTRTTKRKKRIRDSKGNIIGHGKEEVYDSDSNKSYITVSDGKGGKIRIPNPAAAKRKNKDFSDASTDEDELLERMKNMTEEEKKAFLEEHEKRKAAREARRREKYGDKYDEIMAEHNKKKELKKQSMVTYEKGSKRFGDQGEDRRSIGPGHEEWSKKGGRKGKDGHEADSESEFTEDEYGNKVKKKSKRKDSEGSVEVIRDKDGRILKKIRRDKDGNLWVEEYDKDGNVIRRRKKGDESDEDDGNYFEIGPDGKIRLKAGQKKIDLSKLSREDLIRLGIDPNLSKAEIMRLLQEKFGDSIKIVFKGKKVGQKNINEYGKDVDTDDLANDSDLDVDTLRGPMRIKVIMKKGGQALLDHMKKVVEISLLRDSQQPQDEKNSAVDFLSAYRLVDPSKLDLFARSFVVEDADDMDGLINYRAARIALQGVPTISSISNGQMDYVLSVLGIDNTTELSFRMFAVVVSLCERVTKMDQYCRDLLEISNLIDIERKMALYLAMFRQNTLSDRDPNYIKMESLKIELMAGGLNWSQQQFIMSKMKPNDYFEISFLDYLTYVPLFLSFHDNICHNPLDLSNTKYSPSVRRKASVQRDMNPLGQPLSKNSPFFRKQNGSLNDIEIPKIDTAKARKNAKDLMNRYQKLPEISGASYPATPPSLMKRNNGYESCS